MSTEHLFAILAMLLIVGTILVLTRHVHKDGKGGQAAQQPSIDDGALIRWYDRLGYQTKEDAKRLYTVLDEEVPGKHIDIDYPRGNDFDIDHTKLEEAKVLSAPKTIHLRDRVNQAVREHLDYGGAARSLACSSVDGYHWELVIRDRQVELAREEPADLVEQATYWPPSLEKDEQKRQEKTHTVINKLIQHYKRTGYIRNAKGISDGYHTFQELYDMRLALTVAMMKAIGQGKRGLWRSRLHSDSTMFEGMFIVGLTEAATVGGPGVKAGYITFHYHDEHWDKFDFCDTLDKAPKWDGHTDKDVIERLLTL